jgi:hypothetical protein
MYIMEYFDRRYSINCVTVLVRTSRGLMKAPLFDYAQLSYLTQGLLVQVDLAVLPNQIYAFNASYDLVDLSLRMMRGDSAMASGSGAPPTPPPPSPPSNGGEQRVEWLVQADSSMKKPPFPPVEDQTMYIRRRSYQIATLFIYDSNIYAGRLTEEGLKLIRLDARNALHILENYYIIWRDEHYELITDERTILEALNNLMDECARRNISAEIYETEMGRRYAWNSDDIPEWILRCAHRYIVEISR